MLAEWNVRRNAQTVGFNPHVLPHKFLRYSSMVGAVICDGFWTDVP